MKPDLVYRPGRRLVGELAPNKSPAAPVTGHVTPAAKAAERNATYKSVTLQPTLLPEVEQLANWLNANGFAVTYAGGSLVSLLAQFGPQLDAMQNELAALRGYRERTLAATAERVRLSRARKKVGA